MTLQLWGPKPLDPLNPPSGQFQFELGASQSQVERGTVSPNLLKSAKHPSPGQLWEPEGTASGPKGPSSGRGRAETWRRGPPRPGASHSANECLGAGKLRLRYKKVLTLGDAAPRSQSPKPWVFGVLAAGSCDHGARGTCEFGAPWAGQ